jgi:hypothetical protein
MGLPSSHPFENLQLHYSLSGFSVPLCLKTSSILKVLLLSSSRSLSQGHCSWCLSLSRFSSLIMSSSNPGSGFIVPPGQHPPLAVVSKNDHTAWIILATAIGLSCVLIFGAVRIVVRRTISPGARLDDAFLAASTVSSAVSRCWRDHIDIFVWNIRPHANW